MNSHKNLPWIFALGFVLLLSGCAEVAATKEDNAVDAAFPVQKKLYTARF